MELGRFEFFLRPSLQEGEIGSTVSKVNLVGMVTDKTTGEMCFSNQDVVAGVRSLLGATAGMPIKTLLAEQDALIPTDTQQKLPRPKQLATATASPQPAEYSAVPPHAPLPPRRHRIPRPTE